MNQNPEVSEDVYQPPKSLSLVDETEGTGLLGESLTLEQFLRLKAIYRRSVSANIFTGFIFCAMALSFWIVFQNPGQTGIRAVFGCLGLFYLVAGITLGRRSSLGRYLGMLAAVTFLPLLPLGTLVGAYGLYSLIPDWSIFGKTRLMHDEIQKAYRAREMKAARAVKSGLKAR